MENINKTIANNLTILRKNAKLTQLELAEKFNYSDKSISKWENGESLPSIEVLYELTQFYNVTLDALTTSGGVLTDSSQNKPVKDKLFPTKLIITLLAVSTVWILATIIFVTLKLSFDITFSQLYLWAVPISCIVLVVFNSIWGRSMWLFPILSILLWTLLVCFHVGFIQYQIWIIYILGIPLQISIVLWSALLQKPSKRIQRKREREKLSKLDIKPKHNTKAQD